MLLDHNRALRDEIAEGSEGDQVLGEKRIGGLEVDGFDAVGKPLEPGADGVQILSGRFATQTHALASELARQLIASGGGANASTAGGTPANRSTSTSTVSAAQPWPSLEVPRS